MSDLPRIAFLAPLKSPASPVPSGDRTMARLLVDALGRAGFAVSIASHLSTREGAGDEAAQRRIATEADAETQALLAAWRNEPGQSPNLVFTYHCYYKAPDWIGPALAEALAIPYVVAEGSRAPKRAVGPYAFTHAAAEAALDRAAILFAMTRADRPCLEAAKPRGQSIVDLPPFLARPAPAVARAPKADAGILRLLTVAMMRPGDKLASYRLLAETLVRTNDLAFTLDVVGDGPARADVEALMAPFGDRVRFHGRIDDEAYLSALYQMSDLFVWPAVNEAYGMVLLEALAASLPVVAGLEGGVASVVSDGEDGILVPHRDPDALAAALHRLAGDRELRGRMGEAGRRKVADRHTIDHAATILRRTLQPLVTCR